MWDTRVPLWARLLSSFHIGLPLALLWAMRKTGYGPSCSCLTSSNRGRAFVASRFLVCWVQYELCLSRSSLSSLLGTCSCAPCCDFCWSRRVCLLADTLTLELDVSGGRPIDKRDGGSNKNHSKVRRSRSQGAIEREDLDKHSSYCTQQTKSAKRRRARPAICCL